jgi:hypothetical protein
MLLYVSILRSSSGSTYCSLLKLHVKIVNMSLYISVTWQHIVAALASQSTYPPALKTTHTQKTICCYSFVSYKNQILQLNTQNSTEYNSVILKYCRRRLSYEPQPESKHFKLSFCQNIYTHISHIIDEAIQ